jgi:hypothetical protein
VPHDPITRWENEGGAVLLADRAERDPRDEGEAEVNDLKHEKDRNAETATRAPTRRDGSTTSAD